MDELESMLSGINQIQKETYCRTWNNISGIDKGVEIEGGFALAQGLGRRGEQERC